MKVIIEIHRPGWMTPARLRRARPLLLVLALVFAGPVLASDRFSDVPASNIHHDDISAIAAAGITRGCNEGGTQYCPEAVVNREQMGSFLARTAGLGGHPPVTNADKLDGLDASAFLPAGDYVVMQQGPWLPAAGALSTITYHATWTYVEDNTSTNILLALDGPASIGGTGFGFESARICFSPSSDVTINSTSVSQATDTGGDILVSDSTARPMDSGGCYVVTDSTPTAATGGTSLSLHLSYETASTATFRSVTTTWTPVSP